MTCKPSVLITGATLTSVMFFRPGLAKKKISPRTLGLYQLYAKTTPTE